MFMGWAEHNQKISKETSLRESCRYFLDKYGIPLIAVVTEDWMDVIHPEFPELELRLKSFRTPTPQSYLIYIGDEYALKASIA